MTSYADLTAFFGADLATDLVSAPTYSQMSRPSETIEPHRYSQEAADRRKLTSFMLDIREAKRIEDRRAAEAWAPRRR